MMVDQQQITAAVQELGLAGQAVALHVSLRSFGWIEGGADALLDGVLAAGCTVLVPTFSDEYAVAPLPAMHRPRNGADYAWVQGRTWPGHDKIYTPTSNLLEIEEMGTLSATLLARAGRWRGNHPLCSFAAIGPDAEALIAPQQPLAVNAPLAALAASGGSILLMGVGLTQMTLLHLAEQTAGRQLFRRWANDGQGAPMEVEIGGCSDGFERLAPVLAAVEERIRVGDSLWRCFPAAEVIARAATAIRRDPLITRCDRIDCGRCPDAIAGGPVFD